jgi:hypothetical protein
MAEIFMATETAKKMPDLAAISLLAAMCFDKDTSLAEQADAALYQNIIIPLCDDFSINGALNVSHILARLITFTAHRIDGQLRQLLEHENLSREDQLLRRSQRICNKPPLHKTEQGRLKKICILSRVTIGADISITSIIVQRLLCHFPNIPIVLIGPDHLPQLFNSPGLHHKFFKVPGENGLERMENGAGLKQVIAEERGTLKPEEFLLIDPDTRLSQLGLLPLAPERSTYILPSRTVTSDQSLTTITNDWLDTLLGSSHYHYPMVKTKSAPSQKGDKRFTVVVNFGVGHDQNKRISRKFEQDLIMAIIEIGTIHIILDSGSGKEELHQSKAIETYLKEQPLLVQKPDAFKRVEQSVAELACNIKTADLFIGYDSCSGHIATACETPGIICFKGAPNPRFYARWQPQSRQKSTICLKVGQKRPTETERCLLISHIIDIASSHYQSFQHS